MTAPIFQDFEGLTTGQTHQILLTGSAPPVRSRHFDLFLRDPSRPDVRRPRGLPVSGASPRGAGAGDYGYPRRPAQFRYPSFPTASRAVAGRFAVRFAFAGRASSRTR